ncbi:hypothetical protein BDD12DRAFT_467976 [Trichophaea hybrida]|nr:hypothetical protein BDD12DRAFT_467976 [Trichophaea hybrida]
MPYYNPYGITPPHSQEFLGSTPPKDYTQHFSSTPPRSISFDECTLSGSMAAMNIYTPASSQPNSRDASPTDASSGSPTNNSNVYHPSRRPQHLRTMTAGSILTLTPNFSTSHASVQVPTQYQYGQQRPLPPLHRPHPFSSSPRSIDLVTPYMSTFISPRTDPITASCHSPIREETDQEKHTPQSPASAPHRSLKTLFNFDAIRGEPYSAEVSATSPDKYLTYSNGTPILARMSPTSVHFK